LKSVGCVALSVDAFAPRDNTGKFGRFFVSPEMDMYAALALCHSYRSSLGNSMGGYLALLAL
jgi:hypothetical protein